MHEKFKVYFPVNKLIEEYIPIEQEFI